MSEFLRVFINIALLRQGPEDLPSSRFLVLLMIVVALALHAPAVWLVFQSVQPVLTTLLLDIVLLVLCLWALLRFTGRLPRFNQTLTAILGTSTVLSVLILPFVYWNATVPDDMQKPPLPSAVILATVIWSFAIDGHILSRALSQPFAYGLLIAVFYFFLSTTVTVEFMPPV